MIPKLIVVLLSATLTIGCSPVEISKTVWGSSTRALDRARKDAMTRTYGCTYFDCFDAVLELAKTNGYTVFLKDEVRGVIILMGIKGSVNTTEVGVFLEVVEDRRVKIDVSSLSSHAKRLVARPLFKELDERFVQNLKPQESKS